MPNNVENKSKLIKVFYDGKCPLCNKEIMHYQKLDNDGIFDWVDINENKDVLESYNLDYIETQKIFHVIDKEGNFQRGVDGFMVIWRETKYWKILYFIIKLPLIKALADIAYKYFAIWRFKKSCNY